MELHLTSEKHTLMLIALMKFHGIRRVIASPGATCISLVASLQQDPDFEVYSSVDERSAAYIACGMAAESGEPAALICTGSTASRNYAPGLTEAFYRHLPVLAITTTQPIGRVGNLYQQVVDRSMRFPDIVRESVVVDCIHSQEDEWECQNKINRAMIALTSNGGGPSHINLVVDSNSSFSSRALPVVKGIAHSSTCSDIPELTGYKYIALQVGVHGRWSDRLLDSVEEFCQIHNAVVFHNHASNYKGEYGINRGLFNGLRGWKCALPKADLVISFGSVARYPTNMSSAEMWRVSPDGAVFDSERILTRVFQENEASFFERCNVASRDSINTKLYEERYAAQWADLYHDLLSRVGELPFSNVWIAQQLTPRLPNGCVLHMAGSNTARAWNYFELPKGVECYSNDGVMGIDGQVSSLIGESLVAPERLHLGVCGDLTFFYDMNSLGNRHIGTNLRLLVINNGLGAEFKIYSHRAASFGEAGNPYLAAAGHFGNKSSRLLRHYAEDLGFEYRSARNKEEFINGMDAFLSPERTGCPMVFEAFTESDDESDAVYVMNHLAQNKSEVAKDAARDTIRAIAGERGINAMKRILGRQG